MLLQRLHFLRRLPTNVAIYKLKERVEHSTRSFGFCGKLRVEMFFLSNFSRRILDFGFWILDFGF